MRRLYPIDGQEADVGEALAALSVLAGAGVHLLDPRRWLVAELPADLPLRADWPRLEALLAERADGLAVVARAIGMLAEANPPELLWRRLRQLSGEGLRLAREVLGRRVDLLEREPTALAPAELDLLYAALVAALAHQAGEPGDR